LAYQYLLRGITGTINGGTADVQIYNRFLPPVHIHIHIYSNYF